MSRDFWGGTGNFAGGEFGFVGYNSIEPGISSDLIIEELSLRPEIQGQVDANDPTLNNPSAIGSHLELEQNPIIRDVKNFLYHKMTTEEMKLIDFLVDELEQNEKIQVELREFDEYIKPLKRRELFKSEE